MPRLTILIPALGDSGDFEETLASVLQNRPDDSEVIVAHARPYGDPYRLSGEVCFVPKLHAKQKVELLNAGFEAARSGIIHVVQCGLTVDDGWAEPALECFANEQIASVAPVIVDEDSPEQIIAAGQAYTRWGRVIACGAGRKLGRLQPASIIGPTLAAGFYRRSWWRLVRWDETLGDEFADAHFNLTLAHLGAQTVLASDCLLRSGQQPGLAADKPYDFRAARRAERLYWSHAEQEATLGSRALRGALMFGEAVLALPSPRAVSGLLGRVAGLVDQSSPRAFRTHLDDLSARLAARDAEAANTSALSLDQARQQRGKPVAFQKRAA